MSWTPRGTRFEAIVTCFEAIASRLGGWRTQVPFAACRYFLFDLPALRCAGYAGADRLSLTDERHGEGTTQDHSCLSVLAGMRHFSTPSIGLVLPKDAQSGCNLKNLTLPNLKKTNEVD